MNNLFENVANKLCRLKLKSVIIKSHLMNYTIESIAMDHSM